jgi:hypothetical protein
MALIHASQQAMVLDAQTGPKLELQHQGEIAHKVVWDDRGIMLLQANSATEQSVTLWSSASKAAAR